MKILTILITLLIFSSLTVAQSVIVKDGETEPNTLLEINDEGATGSISIPTGAAPSEPAGKLYNESGTLKWSGTTLATGSSLWTLDGSNVYRSSGKVGIGESSPLGLLHLKESVSSIGTTFLINKKDWDDQGTGDHNFIDIKGYWTSEEFTAPTSMIRFYQDEAYPELRMTSLYNANDYLTLNPGGLRIMNQGDGGRVYLNWEEGLLLYNYSTQLAVSIGPNDNVIFNEQGDDIDFRIEGVSEPNALFIHGSDGKIGLGTASPDEKLHIAGNMRLTGTFEDTDGHPGSSGQILSSTGSATDWITAPSAHDAVTIGTANGLSLSTQQMSLSTATTSTAGAMSTTDKTKLDKIASNSTTASGIFSTAMGNFTTASGSNSTAMGQGTTASGSNSTAMGYYTEASSYLTTAMGHETTSNGQISTAMGDGTTSSGYVSTAMGQVTKAIGDASTAMGQGTTANGVVSTAIGKASKANGNVSTAMGFDTDADSYASVVLGRYNVGGGTADSWVSVDPLFEIGIGADGSNKENAMTVLKNGNVGVGTATPSAKLDVNGTVKVGTNGIAFSEIKEVTGTTANGISTTFSYPTGYTQTNTRVLDYQVYSDGGVTYWHGQGGEVRYLLAPTQIYIYTPDDSGFFIQPFRMTIMKIG